MTPFAAALEQVRHELDAGRLSEAHYQLSRWYDDPNLTPQEQQHLNELLDQLAGTVIYSTQNLMEPACEVQQGETLERIAQRYNVPWQLLAKINGIDDPHSLTLVQMVGAGLGVTLIPAMAMAVEAGAAPVSVTHFAAPRPSRTIGMIWRKTTPLAKQLREVCEIVRRAGEGHPQQRGAA